MHDLILKKHLQFITQAITFEDFMNSANQVFAEFYIRAEFDRVFAHKDQEVLDVLFDLVSWCRMEELFLPRFHQMILETWHCRHEQILDIIKHTKHPSSISYIAEAIVLQDIDYLTKHDTDYPAFVRQCMWALADIHTDESISLLKEYRKSENAIIFQFADEQLRWLDGEKEMRVMG